MIRPLITCRPTFGPGFGENQSGMRQAMGPVTPLALLTWNEIAAQLSVSTQSIHQWRQLDGAPTEPELDGWVAYKAKRGLGRDRGSPEDHCAQSGAATRTDQQAMARNLREADAVVDAKVVSEMLKTLANKMDMLLRQKLEVELGPRMVGKNHAEIAIEGRLIHDEIREVLDNNIANYQNEELPIEGEEQQAED